MSLDLILNNIFQSTSLIPCRQNEEPHETHAKLNVSNQHGSSGEAGWPSWLEASWGCTPISITQHMLVTSFVFSLFSMWTCWPLNFLFHTWSLSRYITGNQTNLSAQVNVFIPKERTGNDEGWVWALTSLRARLLHRGFLWNVRKCCYT